MKAKSIRKPVSSTDEPQEYASRIPALEQTNGATAESGEVVYELTGDIPLRNDDFVVLTDNIKCCILRMSDLLRLEARGITAVSTGSARPCSSVALFATAKSALI